MREIIDYLSFLAFIRISPAKSWKKFVLFFFLISLFYLEVISEIFIYLECGAEATKLPHLFDLLASFLVYFLNLHTMTNNTFLLFINKNFTFITNRIKIWFYSLIHRIFFLNTVYILKPLIDLNNDSNQYIFDEIKNYLKIKFTLKLIVWLCTLTYLIIFTIVIYYAYKSYTYGINELTTFKNNQTRNELIELFKYYPNLTYCDVSNIPINNLKEIYNLHGIHNFSELIHIKNNEVDLLHTIMNDNPEFGTKLSNLMIQDLLNNNNKDIAELAEHLLKRVFRFSIPLTILILTLFGIYTADSIQTIGSGSQLFY
jgi:hypothetical protein